MEQIDYKKGINVQGNILLREARFQTLLSPSDDQSVTPIQKDDIAIGDISLSGFVLLFSRRVCFEPSSVFEVYVAFESNIHFEKNEALKSLKSIEDAKEWIDKNKIRIANTFGLPGKASQIISSLTLSAGYDPLVTGPLYLQDRD